MFTPYFGSSSICFALYSFSFFAPSYNLRLFFHICYLKFTLSSGIVEKQFVEAEKGEGEREEIKMGLGWFGETPCIFCCRTNCQPIGSQLAIFLYTPLHLRVCKVCGWYVICLFTVFNF